MAIKLHQDPTFYQGTADVNLASYLDAFSLHVVTTPCTQQAAWSKSNAASRCRLKVSCLPYCESVCVVIVAEIVGAAAVDRCPRIGTEWRGRHSGCRAPRTV